jgi:hypothetical protein
MTIVPWPLRPVPARRAIAGRLPSSVLHSLVAGIPGPKNESEAERSTRFEAQLAEVLAYKPRDVADAMLATQCVVLRVVAQDSNRDAGRPGVSPDMQKKFLRSARQFGKLIDDMEKTMSRRAPRQPNATDAAIYRAPGLEQLLVREPDDAGQTDEAFSAVIVPLHPAPKLLQ